jgi:DNA (cytosine-5)-methyltransferase 1
MSTLGSAIRSQREGLGVGIKTLATELEIDYSYLSKIENEHIKPSKDLLLRLAGALQADADEWSVLAGFLPQDIAIAASTDPSSFLKFLRQSDFLESNKKVSPKKKLPKLPVISLFTGAGGMDLGLEAVGFETVASVEFNSVFRDTIRLNRPHWDPIDDFNGDVTKMTSEFILKRTGLKVGEAALVVGGAPCQPFSNMGMKKGVKDSRGTLFHDFIRLVRELRPKGFIFENVEGLTQGKHKLVIETLEQAFKDIGYAVNSRLLLASDYGAPQKRKRLFIVGCRSGIVPEFPEPTHSRNAEGGKLPWVTVREAFKQIKKDRLKQKDCCQMNHSDEMVKRISLVPAGGNFKNLPSRLLPDCWKSGKYQGQDTFGRLRWDEPSVTIRTCGYNPTKGRYIHPSENRGLNTIEMAVLQTFPPEYRFVGGLKTIGEQIGNAVPPVLAAAVGSQLKIAIKKLDRLENS